MGMKALFVIFALLAATSVFGSGTDESGAPPWELAKSAQEQAKILKKYGVKPPFDPSKPYEIVYPTPAPRPFWAEKISYIEGENFYFVGVSTNQPSIEVARSAALENGRWELSRTVNVNNITGLIIQTERNLEIPEADGRFTVYRLMFVSREELRNVASSQRK